MRLVALVFAILAAAFATPAAAQECSDRLTALIAADDDASRAEINGMLKFERYGRAFTAVHAHLEYEAGVMVLIQRQLDDIAVAMALPEMLDASVRTPLEQVRTQLQEEYAAHKESADKAATALDRLINEACAYALNRDVTNPQGFDEPPGYAVLHLVSVIPDAARDRWAVGEGRIVETETFGTASFTWDALPQDIGTAGILIKLSVEATALKGSRLAAGIQITVSGLDIEPGETLISVDSAGNEAANTDTFTVTPHEGATGLAVIRINAAYGPGVTYNYYYERN